MLTQRTALLDAHWIDFVLQHVDPTLSVTRILARLVAIRDESPDMKTFVFRPSGRPIPFLAGQSVGLRVRIGGVIHERRYSPTSTPGATDLHLSVKRVADGRVSGWLHDDAKLGDVVELCPAAGEMVLPTPLPSRLLFVAGGSGITAVLSLLRAALRADPKADAALLYYGRRYEDLAFAGALRELTAIHPALRVQCCRTHGQETEAADMVPTGHFSREHLETWVADFADRETFACGPGSLIEAVRAQLAVAGRSHRLHTEAFTAIPENMSRGDGSSVPVRFRRSARTVEGTGATLLAIAEDAGLRPATGCRMGICQTCVCTKVCGVVRDRVTGAVDAGAGSRVKLCVSEPLGPVTLDL